MVSEQALKEFKNMWLKELGEEISDDFASVEAHKLLVLMGVIYQPIYETNEKPEDSQV